MIWSVSAIRGTRLALSAQMRDVTRFRELVGAGIELFVDVAGDRHYVWRPDAAEISRHGVEYVRIDGVEDTNVDLPEFAFDRVAESLELSAAAGRRALVFCAAGLKRSPHLLYGVLRSWRWDADAAWAAIVEARPFVDAWAPYLDSAERWAAARS